MTGCCSLCKRIIKAIGIFNQMMAHVFQVVDKTARKIHLSKERWRHIAKEHPQIRDVHEIKLTLLNPLKTTPSKHDLFVRYYYRYNKETARYLMVAVKYINGEGFVITAYYMRHIK